MRQFKISWFASAAIALLCISQANAQTSISKVAIANPAKIFSSLQETNDLKGKMDGDRKGLEATDLEKRTKIHDIQQQRDLLKPDSAAYGDKNKDLMSAKVDYEVWKQVAAGQAEAQQKQQIRSLFEKIAAAVSGVAANKGIDLVIAEVKPTLPDSLDQINLQQLQAVLSQQNVLYSSKSVDISDEVVAAMDAKYKSGK